MELEPADGELGDEQQLDKSRTPSEQPSDDDDVVEPAERSRFSIDLAASTDGTGDFEITVFATEWLDELVALELTLVADDGSGAHTSVELATVEVEPGGLVTTPTSAATTQFDMAALEFAGRLEVIAHVVGEEGRVESAYSEPLFFWPENGVGLNIVAELPSHRGDFEGSVLPALAGNDDNGIRLDRVVGSPVGPEDADEPSPGDSDEGTSHEQLDRALGAPETQAVTKTLCASLRVSAADSSIMFRTNPSVPEPPLEEDWGATTGDGSTGRPTKFWRARNAGYRLCKVDSGTGLCVYGPTAYLGSDGCVSVQVDVGPTYIFELQSRSEDSNGNHWRTYEDTSGCVTSCNADRPGDVLATTTSFTFDSSSTKNLYLTGSDQDFWSTSAFVGTSLYRQRHGLSNTNLNACLDSDDNSRVLDTNWALGRACLEIGDGTQPRRKYLVSHEIGHAVGYMSAGDDFNTATLDYDAEYEKDSEIGSCLGGGVGSSPPAPNPVLDWIDSDQDRMSDAGECFDPCTNYNINTLEWDALAFREAFAHFYAARVMNNRARDAIFTWNNSPDTNTLVRFPLDDDTDGIPNGLGRMHDVCCEPTGSPSAPSNCDDDASTIRDWTGALWNWYGSYWDEACAGDDWVDWSDVVAVVDQTIQNIGASDKKRGWEEFRDAVQDQWPASSTDCQYETWSDQGQQFQLWN